MRIEIFTTGFFATNSYLVWDETTKNCFIVDAPPDCYPLLKKFIEENSLHPQALLLTHSHSDHIADAKEVQESFHIPLAIHPLDVPNIKAPGSDGLPLFFDCPATLPNRLFTDNEKLVISPFQMQVIPTPGHTPGGVSFYLQKEGVLFSGDTLFQGTIGNLSFPTSEPEKMWDSLKKLGTLPKETVVYPGHGERTTIGSEPWLSYPEEYFN